MEFPATYWNMSVVVADEPWYPYVLTWTLCIFLRVNSEELSPWKLITSKMFGSWGRRSVCDFRDRDIIYKFVSESSFNILHTFDPTVTDTVQLILRLQRWLTIIPIIMSKHYEKVARLSVCCQSKRGAALHTPEHIFSLSFTALQSCLLNTEASCPWTMSVQNTSIVRWKLNALFNNFSTCRSPLLEAAPVL